MDKETISFDPKRFEKLPVEELLEIYSKYNSSEILELIISKNKDLVYSIAARFKNSNHDFKDIVQVGFTGLLVAVNRFDVKQKNKFSTFAYYCIKGEIQHYIRDNNPVKIPRWLWCINNIFNDYVKRFNIENGRYPTKEEISKGINISIESIDDILRAREASFYNRSINIEDDNRVIDKGIIRSREPRSFELVMEDKILLWDAIDRLKGFNKRILILKYVFGFSQEEIGKDLGISQRSVSRKIKDSIDILRDKIL
jgi:RNA polymerase sporulation-specific sigma factor